MIPKAQNIPLAFSASNLRTQSFILLWLSLLIWLLVILLKLQSKLCNHLQIQREDENRDFRVFEQNIYNSHINPLWRSVKTTGFKRSLLKFHFALPATPDLGTGIPELSIFLERSIQFSVKWEVMI